MSHLGRKRTCVKCRHIRSAMLSIGVAELSALFWDSTHRAPATANRSDADMLIHLKAFASTPDRLNCGEAGAA